MEYEIKLRRGCGWDVKREMNLFDGNTFEFEEGWPIEEGMYKGETAMIFKNMPTEYVRAGFPLWIGSGDLVGFNK